MFRLREIIVVCFVFFFPVVLTVENLTEQLNEKYFVVIAEELL